jgi:hypothetical protein
VPADPPQPVRIQAYLVRLGIGLELAHRSPFLSIRPTGERLPYRTLCPPGQENRFLRGQELRYVPAFTAYGPRRQDVTRTDI